ncbi:MAG: Xaa-Pro peptidase family protein [Clostridia bacterium]
MKDRLFRLNGLMRERGLSAALITTPENMRYLTGFTGEGAVLIGTGCATILTDFRYLEQATRQAPDCASVRTLSGASSASEVRGILLNAGLRRLAIEPVNMTVSAYKTLHDAMPEVELVDLQGLPEALRVVKDEGEIEALLRAAKVSCAAFDKVLGLIHPGMTEREVQLSLDEAMLRGGAECVAFPTIACAGANGALPHATPSDAPIKAGDLLTMDFGAQVDGYKSDMTRTVGIGHVSSALRDIYETVLEAQLLGLSLVRPGSDARAIDASVRALIDKKYAGAFGHSLGHGVGLVIHEAPNLSTRSSDVLESGHVVTVEPGVYIPGLGGCRIEDTVILHPKGFTNTITAPKQLLLL